MPKEIPPPAARWSSEDVNRELSDPPIELNAHEVDAIIQEEETHVKEKEAPAQENEISNQEEGEAANQGEKDHGNTESSEISNRPRQASTVEWIRLLQVYQVYKFLAYRQQYDAHTSMFTFYMMDNYLTWRRGQFIDGLAFYWRRFWSAHGELSNAPLEWKSKYLSGTENDEILRANIEKIFLDDMEGKSLQDAVKDAWTFFVSENNRHPRDSYWYGFWMQRWQLFSEEKHETFLSSLNCDAEAIKEWNRDVKARTLVNPEAKQTKAFKKWLKNPTCLVTPADKSYAGSVWKELSGIHGDMELNQFDMGLENFAPEEMFLFEKGIHNLPSLPVKKCLEEMLERLEHFLPNIPGGRPHVEVSDNDIDLFYERVLAPSARDLLEYVHVNQFTAEEEEELRNLGKETYFVLRDQLKAFFDYDKNKYQQAAYRMSQIFAKRTTLQFFKTLEEGEQVTYI